MFRPSLVPALLCALVMVFTALPLAPAATAVESDPVASMVASNDPAEYVVVMKDDPLALYDGAIIGLDATNPEVLGQRKLDPSSAASAAYLAYLDTQRTALVTLMSASLARSVEVGFRYSYAIAGFSTTLTTSEAAVVATLPNVAMVHRQEYLHTLTDNGPSWMDADAVWSGAATGVGTRGAGIVAGVIDTGVNSDHPSFAGVGPVDGYVHTNPRGVRYGVCAANITKCNDKLIGLYDFTGTGEEDDNGHGTHTASTVAGNVVDAVLYAPTTTLPSRRISGVAPHANVISYKACTSTAFPVLGGCPITAIIASIDQATADVVDVINFSIGGGSVDPWADPLGRSFYGSRAAGIFVAASAGNSGPNAQTIGRPSNSPWVMSVGASTHDRRPTGRVQLGGGASAHAEIVGMTVAAGLPATALIDAKALGNEMCTPFNATGAAQIAGKVVVCTQGVIGRVAKGVNVKAAGGAGMILVSQPGYKNSVVTDAHVLPAVQIGEFDGASLRTWLASGTGHTAALSGTTLEQNAALADRMAGFSSRGPDLSLQNVIKPDVTAPGVAILAAFSTHSGPAGTPEYAMIQGTSMSSPHAAGAAALVRAAKPGWGPDQIKSALMSTAFTRPDGGKEVVPVTKEDHATASDPFDRGGGRIDVAGAVRAGLTLDVSFAAYEAANPALSGPAGARSLNLASFANDDCTLVCSWTRSVTSTASTSVAWSAAATGSNGFTLSVSPATFTLAPGASQTITVTATNTGLAPGFWEFGEVSLTATGFPAQRLPVAVKAKGGAVEPPCFIPDTVVVTDPADVGTLPQHDIRELRAAGIYPTFAGRDLPNITLKMKVTHLDPLPTTSHWRIAFTTPGAPPNTQYFVSMTMGASGEPTFTYGTLVPGTFSTLGAPESGTYNKDGTISITIATSKIGSPKVGDQLTNINGSAGPAVPGTLTTNTDSAGPGTYTLTECQNPELSISSSDITTSGVKESTVIRATVRNTGTGDSPNTKVRFLVNGAQQGTDQVVSVPAGGSATAQVGWDTTHLRGRYTITVIVDPDNEIPEADKSNNTASITVRVQGNRVR